MDAVFPELCLVVSALAGHGAGRLVGRTFAGLAEHRAARALVPCLGAAASLALLAWLRVAFWDAALLALAFAAGTSTGLAGAFGHDAGVWRGRAVTCVAVVVPALFAEAAVSLSSPEGPAGYWEEEPLALREPEIDLEHARVRRRTRFDIPVDLDACNAIYAAADQRPPPFAAIDAARTRALPAVLHAGDSMTQGAGLASLDSRFTEIVERATPGTPQLNFGLPATGTDVHALVLRAWVPRLPVRLVVLHVFVGNDLENLDQPYRCCDDGPLLGDVGGRAVARCPRARFPEGYGRSLSWLVSTSPAPAVLRQLGTWSVLARRVVVRFWVRRGTAAHAFVSDELDHTGAGEADVELPARYRARQLARFEQIMREVRDDLRGRDVDLVVSVLPLRAALERAEPRDTPTYQLDREMLAALGRLGIRAIDPWGVFEDAVRRGGAEAVYLPHDLHMNAQGHALYARWLLDAIGAELGHVADGASAPRGAPARD